MFMSEQPESCEITPLQGTAGRPREAGASAIWRKLAGRIVVKTRRAASGGVEQVNASHVATGTITALLATALVYLSHWPLKPLDLSTASAFAGLLVAAGGALVKLYKSRITPATAPSASVVPIMASNAPHEPPKAA
jgi:hypothetical protein